jgi:glycyl-tRNA synthetase beta chain
VSARDLLIEIGTEELPPKSLPLLSQALESEFLAQIRQAGLAFRATTRYAAPRRLALLVSALATRQADQPQKRRGPPVSAAFAADGSPTRAAQAFAESCGVPVTSLGRVTEPKGEFLYYEGVRRGAETASLVIAMLNESLAKLPIARRMRWGAGDAEFVRPVHWVVVLFGDQVIAGQIMGVATGRNTQGHRFMAPRRIALKIPASYAKTLERSGKVIAEFAARRDRIAAGVAKLAAERGGTAVLHDLLLDEVAALTEFPVPIAGRFDPNYLELPPEVLIATLEDQQRCFPVRDQQGALKPLFVAVANLVSRDPEQVRLGNERVVRPRLADAAFFWNSDRATPLAARRESLKQVTFQARLGSYFAKSERVSGLCVQLAPATGANAGHCARAAELAKCDLLTGLVGEFPELQGIMGGYYARHDGEPEPVAAAIAEQYRPRYAGDALPESPAGTALAIADKIDTIVGIFAIGQRPTGARDPFGLRRAALGVVRICIEGGVELDLPELIASAERQVFADLAAGAAAGAQPADLAGAVYDYLLERLRAYYLESERGFTTEMFDAVLAKRPRSPREFDLRLGALKEFLALPDAQALTSAYKRTANILRQAGDAPISSRTVGAEPAERALDAALGALNAPVAALIGGREYRSALSALAGLRGPVDAFFDSVLVMAEDPALRMSRLALLARLRDAFLSIADLSRLPG